jgi:hypothetical protein
MGVEHCWIPAVTSDVIIGRMTLDIIVAFGVRVIYVPFVVINTATC